MAGRLPDFVIIGTMKSGTTSLFRWLGSVPDCALPTMKEPAYFSHDATFARGLEWYESLFPAGEEQRTGEASVAYTDPDRAAVAAERLSRVLPDAALVCILRHPIERMRSHHAHERLRGRERGSLADVTTASIYARASCYASCLAPWLDRAADRLLVIRFEDLVGPDDATWRRVLSHVGLPDAPRPAIQHNRTDDKQAFSPVMRRLWDRGIRRPPRRAPRVLRSLAKRVLLREAESDPGGVTPPEVAAMIWNDVERLEARLGCGELWARGG